MYEKPTAKVPRGDGDKEVQKRVVRRKAARTPSHLFGDRSRDRFARLLLLALLGALHFVGSPNVQQSIERLAVRIVDGIAAKQPDS